MAEYGRAAVARRRRRNSGWWCTGALLIGVNLAAGVLTRTVAQGRRPDDLQPNELLVIAAGGLLFLGSMAWWWTENRRLQRRTHLGTMAGLESRTASTAPSRATERPLEPAAAARRLAAPDPALLALWDPPASAAVGLDEPKGAPSTPPRQLRELRGLSATMVRRMTDAGYPTQRELAAVRDEHVEDLAEDLGTFPYRLVAWVAEARANTAPDSHYKRSA